MDVVPCQSFWKISMNEYHRSYQMLIGELISLRNVLIIQHEKKAMLMKNPSSKLYQSKNISYVQWCSHAGERAQYRDSNIFKILNEHKDTLIQRMKLNPTLKGEQRFLIIIKEKMSGKRHGVLCSFNEEINALNVITIIGHQQDYHHTSNVKRLDITLNI